MYIHLVHIEGQDPSGSWNTAVSQKILQQIDSVETCRHHWEGGATPNLNRPPVCGFFWLRRFQSPNESRTDPERIPHGPRTHPTRTLHGPCADLEQKPNGPRTDLSRTSCEHRTHPKRTSVTRIFSETLLQLYGRGWGVFLCANVANSKGSSCCSCCHLRCSPCFLHRFC